MMKRSETPSLIALLCLAVASVWAVAENWNLYQAHEKHRTEFSALQQTLRERRKSRAANSAVERNNQSGLERLGEQAFSQAALPEFIEDFDRRLAGRSLNREDVAYAPKGAFGSFGLVRIQMRLSGPYDEFRRFLADLEARPDLLWVNSVRAAQEKTVMKYQLNLFVLARSGP